MHLKMARTMCSIIPLFALLSLPLPSQAGEPLFKIQLLLGETSFPPSMGWYSAPTSRFVSITNQSGSSMQMSCQLPRQYSVDDTHSTCGQVLNSLETCLLAVMFNPSEVGRFSGSVKIKDPTQIARGGFDQFCESEDVFSHAIVSKKAIRYTNGLVGRDRPADS